MGVTMTVLATPLGNIGLPYSYTFNVPARLGPSSDFSSLEHRTNNMRGYSTNMYGVDGCTERFPQSILSPKIIVRATETPSLGSALKVIQAPIVKLAGPFSIYNSR